MILGSDIASYQGAPDFSQYKASGRQFVLIKATEGTGYVNPFFATNRVNAHAQGLGVGLYHYADGGHSLDEAKHFIDTCGSLVTGEVLMLDWEVGYSDPVGWCKQFLDYVFDRTGVRPLIYLNQSLNNSYDWSSVVSANYGLVLAVYDNNTNGAPRTDWPFVAIKQYTSSGRVPGINGNVDLDVFYGDLTAFQRYGKQNGQPQPPRPTPSPTPAPAPANDYVVRPGDTLSGIAASHGLTLQQIEQLNPQIKNPNTIYPGQVIHLGGIRPQQQKYIVRPGDNLTAIAASFGLSLNQLLAINPQISNPNLIYPGQVINV
jgi:lysozyme